MSRKKNTGRIEQCSKKEGDVTNDPNLLPVDQFYKRNGRRLDAIKESIANSDIDTLCLWIPELEDLLQRARDYIFTLAVEECANAADNDLPF
jgi:hypothetical protein